MWKEHQRGSVSSLSSPTSCLHGLSGATHLPELPSPVPWGSHCCVYLAGGVLAKMLHPRVLKLEGTLESPGGLLQTLRPHPRAPALVSLGRGLRKRRVRFPGVSDAACAGPTSLC